MNKATKTLINKIDSLSETGARFASVQYTNAEGETSRYVILLGYNYGRLLKTSLATVKKARVSTDLDKKAKANVIASLEKSIEANKKGTVSEDYTAKDAYKEIVPGVKKHIDTGIVHIMGLFISKKVIIPGNYGPDTRRELIKAQDALKKKTPMSKIRQFKLTPEQMDLVKFGGLEIRF